MPKPIAENLFRLEAKELQLLGFFRGFKCGNFIIRKGSRHLITYIEADFEEEYAKPKIIISYRTNLRQPSEQSHMTEIPVVTAPCRFGGKRYWFLCPACGKNCRLLYLHDNYFGCFRCHNITYESQKLSGMWKVGGKVISFPELESMKENLGRIIYAGKPTKRFIKYKMAEVKSIGGFMGTARTIDAKSGRNGSFWAKMGKPWDKFGKRGKTGGKVAKTTKPR